MTIWFFSRNCVSLYAALLLTVALSSGACAHEPDETARRVRICSIINLIATPERYDGIRVRTIGVATTEFEGDAIFLSYDDARDSVVWNAVGMSLEGSGITEERKAALHMKRVLIEGEFHAEKSEGAGGWRGDISNITLIYALSDVEIE